MEKINKDTIMIDNCEVKPKGERNLLELIRSVGIDIPTFCYHSELSVYGACRLCLVEIDGMGVQASCSIKPTPGMNVKTNTKKIREMRKIALELILANHDGSCTTCSKSAACRLQELAKRFGINEIRFKKREKMDALDVKGNSLVRDPNKCVLCGDCVRMCHEVQGVGAIDMTGRGSNVMVNPAFSKSLCDTECVYCGQCARVCPTGAITPKSHIEEVYNHIFDKSKTVVVQFAPAVRVAIGEEFGYTPGENVTGKMVAALKRLGFDLVYDTSFAADLTVIEEGNEFIAKKTKGEKLPLFTSCCPGWVRFAEHKFPELLGNLSTCKSPQQMFGTVIREALPNLIGKDNKDIVVVSIMPCTAKKDEAEKEKYSKNGIKDVDVVLTTQELARMIKDAGIDFNSIEAESLDLPFGFKSGAGVIFGTTAGVTEAVLRYVTEKISGKPNTNFEFKEVRGNKGILEAEYDVNGLSVKLAVVYGLKNAEIIASKVVQGKADYDLIEVMACPSGCVGGAGQPVEHSTKKRAMRTAGLYHNDKTLQVHKAQDNPFISESYAKFLDGIGSSKSHKLLHTSYTNRKKSVVHENTQPDCK